MICFGIFFKNQWLAFLNYFVRELWEKGLYPDGWKKYSSKIFLVIHFVVILEFVFSHDEKNAKRGKVAKKPRPIKTSVGRASHFVAFTADICITEEFSIRLKLDTYNSSSKVSSHCIFYYEFFVPQPATQWRNNLAKGNFAQFIPIS